MIRCLLITLMTLCLLAKTTWLIGIILMVFILNYYRPYEDVEV